uniref:Ketoacyl-ACP Synthase III KAS III Plastid 3-keto-acyl-ACP synthase III n=1 Tax=Rhizophora mucronata TaxID=61149 RepID=A0A2P2Q014_RHIMU
MCTTIPCQHHWNQLLPSAKLFLLPLLPEKSSYLFL